MLRITFVLFGLSLVVSAPGQIVIDSLLHQGYQRKYTVYAPPSYDPGVPTPVVLNLHGGSGNMQNVQGFTLMNPTAAFFGFLAVYPEGYGIAPPGFSWADGRNTSADQAGIDDVGFIAALIDTLAAMYNLDPERVYACGFSNGGFMTQRLACEIPERFAAIGSLGCSMDTVRYSTCAPSRTIPMAFFAGTADPEVPYAGGAMSNPDVLPIVAVDSAVQFWVAHNECATTLPGVLLPDLVTDDSSTVEVYDFTDCLCDADVRFYKLLGAGHTWPGVEIAALEPVLGATNEDIQGSVELWNFFNAHVRCLTTSVGDRTDEDAPLDIHPVPAGSFLWVRSPGSVPGPIRVIDLSGRVCIASGPTGMLDVSQLRSGTYVLEVMIDGRSQRVVFAKE